MSHPATSIPSSTTGPPSNVGVAARPKRPAARRSDGPEGVADAAALANLPFDTLLAAMRASRQSQRMLAGGEASPQEMFEPAPGDSNHRGPGSPHATYSGRANLQALEEQGYGDPPRDDTTAAAGQTPAGRGEAEATRGPGDATTDKVAANRASDALSVAYGKGDTAARSSSELMAGTNAGGKPAPSTNTAGVGGALPRTDAVRIAPPVFGGISPGRPAEATTSNAAEQIGSILGTVRPGATTSLLAAQTAGQNTAHTRTPSQALPSSETPSAPTSRPQEGFGESTEVEGPPRSPFESLVRAIRLSTGEQFSSARMWLQPPELGRMHVDLRMKGHQVRIGVRTETAAARRIVAERAAELTRALREHGITVDELTVVVESSEAIVDESGGFAPLGPGGFFRTAAHDSSPSAFAGPAATPGRRTDSGNVPSDSSAVAEPRLNVRA